MSGCPPKGDNVNGPLLVAVGAGGLFAVALIAINDYFRMGALGIQPKWGEEANLLTALALVACLIIYWGW